VTSRKGEISYSRIRREWPHHVAISADKVMSDRYDLVHGFANTLSVAPRGLGMRRDDVDYVVFCFAKPEDADAFAQRFGAERLAPSLRSKIKLVRVELIGE
jgi:hypothetical protein